MVKGIKHKGVVFSLGLLTLACFPSYANDGQNDVYQADFFAQYTPENALEMVQRLPGFNFDSGSNARGFGSNAGNVLIDGARPTSKSGGLSGALIRIPAAQVERIEIIRGGAGAGEAAGQSIVANVIRKTEGSSGRWALKYRQTKGANPEPNLEWALTTQLAGWDTSFDADIGGRPGYRKAILDTTDEQGQLDNGVDEDLKERVRWTFLNGEGSNEVFGGKLTLNGRVGGDEWRGDPKRKVYDGRMPDDSAHDSYMEFNDRFKFRVAEFGADWTKTTDQWKLRVIGLANRETEEFSSDAEFGEVVSGISDNISYSEKGTQTELIFRTTLSQESAGAFKPEFGIEVANNELDASSIFAVNGEVESVGNDAVVVEEKRAEAFVNMSYTLSENLSLEGGITAEISKIEVSSADADNHTLTFYKPRLSATYQINDSQTLTMEVERKVGQLDFEDFAASADLQDGNSNFGNSNLQPDKSTDLELTYDWSFSERGSFKMRAYYNWRKDVLEHIYLNSDPQNPAVGKGNAGDAQFWGVDTDLNIPLDFIIENGLLEIHHFYAGSSFDDDIIGAQRPLSYYVDNGFNFKFRQDLTDHKIAWGMTYWSHFIESAYRVDEYQTFRGNNRTEFFIETTRYLDMKIKFEVEHANGAQYTRTRYIYSPDRSGELDRVERSRRFRDPLYTLSISGTF